MKKTIEQILLDSLKDKHVTAYMWDNTNPSFSGFVRDIKISQDWDGALVKFTLDVGEKEFVEQEVYVDSSIEFEIC